jgi:16S rRNA pseudouridine516 synthase
MDLIPENYKNAGVKPVGRLDIDTDGLLLFTNDGDLAQKLMSPSSNIPKTYRVDINRSIEKIDIDKIKKGLFLPMLRIYTRPAKVSVEGKKGTRILITINEGKNRQIRHTFTTLGYKVKRLTRVSYGNLILKGISLGSFKIIKGSLLRTMIQNYKPSTP